MTIDSLYLTFDSDVVMSIYGQNGAGKSTLIYAIAFAITGYRYGESYRDYVMTGKDHAKVVLNADLKGKPITYTIDIKGKNKTGNPIKKTVLYDGVEYLNSDYAQFMKEHDLDTIENLMFLFQGNKEIIEAKPAERAATLKKLFQFEFDDIVESLKSKQEESKNILIETNAIVNELKTRVFDRIPLQREIMPQAITNWENRIKEIDDTLASIGNVDESSITKCEDELIRCQTQLDAYNSKIKANTTQSEVLKEKILDIEKKIVLERDDDKVTLQAWDQHINQVVDSYERDKNKYNEYEAQIRVKNYELSEIEKQLKISETGVCHACGQAIGMDHIKNLQAKKSKVEEEIDSLKGDQASIGFSEESHKKVMSVLNNRRSKLVERDNRKLQNERDLQSFKEKLSNVSELLNTQLSYAKSLEDNIERLNEEVAQFEKIKPLLAQRDSLVNEQNKLIQSVDNAKSIIISNRERRKNNALIKKEEEERDSKLVSMQLKSNQVAIDINSSKTSIDIFENLFPNFIILQACKKLEDYINSIVQRLFPYMKVSLKQNRSGVNFYYTVGDTQEELAVCMASGAQKMILSLAYSVALARMYGLNCILIDEADASMTPENAKLVYDFIASLDDFSQIIFISHREESREAMKNSGRDNVIFYEVSNGNYNQVSG